MRNYFSKSNFKKNLSLLKRKISETNFLFEDESFQIFSPLKPVAKSSGRFDLLYRNQKGEIRCLDADQKQLSNFHSLKNATNLEDYDILFFVGLGLGYDCREIIINLRKKPRIIVLEPSLEIFNLAIRMVDLTGVFGYERLDLLVGSSISIQKLSEKYKQLIPLGKNRIYTIPSYRSLYGERILRIEEELKDNIRAIRDNWYTAKNNGKKMLSNTVTNLSSLFASTAMDNLLGRFEGVPAVCVAAGPSLDDALNSLQKIQDRALIIACDSSISALLQCGITPHIVVTTDIYRTNFAKVKNHVNQMRDSILIFGIESNPANIKKFLGHKKVAVSSSSGILLDWLDKKWKLNCRLPSLTSVGQMATFLASAFGADPIILVGMDLSFPTGISHSAASVFQENLDQNKLIKIAGTNGNPLYSSPQLMADKIFLEGEIEKNRRRFINTSMDGAFIKGTDIKSLKEILATEIKGDALVNGRLSEIDWSPVISGTGAVAEFNEMLQKVNRFIRICDDHEKKITGLIQNRQVPEPEGRKAERLKALKHEFDTFRQKNGLIIGVIEIAIGEEIHEILKKREWLAAKANSDQNRKNFDEIDLIRDHYRAYRKGALFFRNRLNQNKDDSEGALAYRLPGNVGDTKALLNMHLKLGRHYASIGELWQAEREYHSAIRLGSEAPSPWLELIQMFADSELWRSAWDHIEKASRTFPNSAELMELKTDVENKIQAIMEQIKDAWGTGDKETTRRLLSGYLLLCPEDEQANLLREVLKEVDDTLAAVSPIAQQRKSSQLPFDELVANASQYIENLEFERAIGIMEGLIQSYPQMKAAFREKIGDIRMLQKDYSSAAWNFEQVLKLIPLHSPKILDKLNLARKNSGNM